jgi:hypothetical protein
MTNTPLSVLEDMILQDAKAYANKEDNLMAIKLWKYSLGIKKRYQVEESKMMVKMRKEILKEFKIKKQAQTKKK